MRPRDLPSLARLAKRNPHGTRVKYFYGCRCRRCVRNYRAYVEQLEINKANGQRNNLVPIDGVREFLLDLQKLGIGYQTVAKHVGVGKTGLGLILWPGIRPRQFIRAQKEKKVLSYVPTLETMPRHLKIPADETVRMLRQMIAWGYPQRLIGREALGDKWTLQVHALKGRCATVKVSTALAIRDFYDMVVAIREEWQVKGNQILPRHYVYWKPDSIGCTVRQMELRPVIKSFDYHYRYPLELRQAIQLTNLLAKKTKETKHAQELAGRSAQSPVRHAGKSDRRQSDQRSGGAKNPSCTRQGRGRRQPDNYRSGQNRERVLPRNGRAAGYGFLRQAAPSAAVDARQ